MKPGLGREEGVFSGPEHTEMCSSEVDYYSRTDAEIVEMVHRCSFNWFSSVGNYFHLFNMD